MRLGKALPTSPLVDSIYKNNPLKQGDCQYVAKKRELNSKLSKHQVDLIRYLVEMDFKNYLIAEYFDTTRSVISKVKGKGLLINHVSPFEETFGTVGRKINKELLAKFGIENKDDIDKFCKFYFSKIMILTQECGKENRLQERFMQELSKVVMNIITSSEKVGVE